VLQVVPLLPLRPLSPLSPLSLRVVRPLWAVPGLRSSDAPFVLAAFAAVEALFLVYVRECFWVRWGAAVRDRWRAAAASGGVSVTGGDGRRPATGGGGAAERDRWRAAAGRRRGGGTQIRLPSNPPLLPEPTFRTA